MEFDIMFDDLTKEAQNNLCAAFNTTSRKENWDVFSVVTICREEDDDTDIQCIDC